MEGIVGIFGCQDTQYSGKRKGLSEKIGKAFYSGLFKCTDEKINLFLSAL
jgi:hypothetical protein